MIFFCNIQICEVTFKNKINESRTEFLASSIFEKIYKSKPLKNKDETKTSVDPHNHNWPNGKKWFTCYVCVCVCVCAGKGGGGNFTPYWSSLYNSEKVKAVTLAFCRIQ